MTKNYNRIILTMIAVAMLSSCAAFGKDDSDVNSNENIDNGGNLGGNNSDNSGNSGEISVMYLYINDNKIEVTLAENRAADALVDILKQGDITYTVGDYGDFEKVGSLGHTLPRNDTQITTQAGDVILYSGNQIVLFYGSNSWSYTRLGRINGYSASELRTLLGVGSGSIQVRISLK